MLVGKLVPTMQKWAAFRDKTSDVRPRYLYASKWSAYKVDRLELRNAPALEAYKW